MSQQKIEREHRLLSRRKFLGAFLAAGGSILAAKGLDDLVADDQVPGTGPGPSSFYQLNDVRKIQQVNDGDVWAFNAANNAWANFAPTSLTSFQHAILSSQHSDTMPATIADGDILYVDKTSHKWQRLARGVGTAFLKTGTALGNPGWTVLNYNLIGGTVPIANMPHGHDSNSNTPLATPAADQAFTTAVLANITSLTISLRSRNGSQGLFGYIYVNIVFQMSAATVQGEITITEDAVTQAYTIPVQGNTGWTTVFFFYPINSGTGFLDNATHTYQIQARITNPPGTMTIAGGTANPAYISFLSGVDLGTTLPIA